MSAPVFIDSGAWIALLHRADSLHESTVELYRKLIDNRRIFLTTSLILVEVANAFSMPGRWHLAIELENRLQASAICDVTWIDQQLYERSWNLYRERVDKDWSLVDCSSFVLMKERHITEALTADRHFEQAGFTKLI